MAKKGFPKKSFPRNPSHDVLGFVLKNRTFSDCWCVVRTNDSGFVRAGGQSVIETAIVPIIITPNVTIITLSQFSRTMTCRFVWTAVLLTAGASTLMASGIDPSSFCDGLTNGSRSQVCLSGDCDMNCTAANTQQCDQLCLWVPCTGLRCSSPSCLQRCVVGNCSDVSCSADQECLQSCNHNCSAVVCDARRCTQQCEKGLCEMEARGGEYADQTSSGRESRLSCAARECTQTCSGENCGLACNRAAHKCSQACKGPCKMDCAANTCELACTGGLCDLACSTGAEACEQTCARGGCQLDCTANTCFQTCTEGKCGINCTADRCTQECGHDCEPMRCSAAECVQSCPKGECQMECTASARICEMSCPGGNCRMHCDGHSCKRNCPDNTCTLTGSGREVPYPTQAPTVRGAGGRLTLPTLVVLTAALTVAVPHF